MWYPLKHSKVGETLPTPSSSLSHLPYLTPTQPGYEAIFLSYPPIPSFSLPSPTPSSSLSSPTPSSSLSSPPSPLPTPSSSPPPLPLPYSLLFSPIPIAVVGCRPHCKYCLIEVPFVTLHHQLMRSANHFHVVGGSELSKGGKKRGRKKERKVGRKEGDGETGVG